MKMNISGWNNFDFILTAITKTTFILYKMAEMSVIFTYNNGRWISLLCIKSMFHHHWVKYLVKENSVSECFPLQINYVPLVVIETWHFYDDIVKAF